MVDLTTTYMGLTLKNPVVPSARRCRPTWTPSSGWKMLARRPWSCTRSLRSRSSSKPRHWLTFCEHGTDSFAEALSYFPHVHEYRREPDDYVEHIRKAKEAVDIPIIPSLNGISPGGWTSYAKQFEEAGADAVELNVYFIPTDFNLMSYDVEDLYVKLLKEVKKQRQHPGGR